MVSPYDLLVQPTYRNKKIKAPVLLSVMILQTSRELLDGVFCITQQHVCIVLQENRIVHASISSSQTSLHYNDLFGVPDAQYWHARNLRVGIIFCGGIYRVILWKPVSNEGVSFQIDVTNATFLKQWRRLCSLRLYGKLTAPMTNVTSVSPKSSLISSISSTIS